MTTYKKDLRTIALLFAALIALSTLGWFWHYTQILKKDLDLNKLRQDSILSTKLLLDKEINDLNLRLEECRKKLQERDSFIHPTKSF